MKIPKMIIPRATQVLITANLITPDELSDSTVIDMTKQSVTLSEYQYVVRVGSMVRDLEPNQLVAFNPERFAKYKQVKSKVQAAVEGYEKVLIGYEFPIIELEDGPYILVDSNDIKFIVDGGLVDYTPPVATSVVDDELAPFINKEDTYIVN